MRLSTLETVGNDYKPTHTNVISMHDKYPCVFEKTTTAKAIHNDGSQQ